MSTGPQQGWKTKRDKAFNKQAAYDERADIHAQRAAMAAAAAEANRAALEARKAAFLAARCTCPVCDTGAIPLDLAERVITALARLPVSVPVDHSVLNALRHIAYGDSVERFAFPETETKLHHPRRVNAAADVTVTETATISPKDTRAIPHKPHKRPTAAELAAATGDEEAIDLED
ncbi:hypothetical protein ABS771_08485 [Methylobacterium brachiatum]|uniref:Uncharacterized protein n=1 Tax=Methylobacterium brachiatum TaxID=269660 RepID=A0ABV1QVL2_9HYPH